MISVKPVAVYLQGLCISKDYKLIPEIPA